MATINFQLYGTKPEKNIYIYVSLGRGQVYKVNTGYIINKDHWGKSHRPKQTIAELKTLSDDLDKLETDIKKSLNLAITERETINSEWLRRQIYKFQGKTNPETERDNSIFLNYFQTYIDSLPYNVQRNGTIGVTPRTILRFKSIKKLIEEYEKNKKKRIYIKDIDQKFQKDFITYLSKEQNYSNNYMGSIIRNIKTICISAKTNGIETNSNMLELKSFKERVSIITLSKEELTTIKEKVFEREALQNAKDWLIIGCYIGQRVSDLLKLTKENISVINGVPYIQLTQQKTKKLVVVPLYKEVKEILDKRNGEFPYPISDQRFNEYIKDIARLSDINEKIKGNVINPETKRKEKGTFEKWELVTSHICRRSFATNFYGDIPTALLISITGHSTEKQFLEYIGKTPIDNAMQLAKYWERISQ